MTIAGESAQDGFWTRLWKNPALRYVFLAPTVLTTIANVQEIGRLARWITSGWRPLLDRLEVQVAHLLPHFGIPAKAVVILLFFFPFTLTGLAQAVANPRRTISPLTAFLACMAFALILYVVAFEDSSMGVSIFIIYLVFFAVVVALCSLAHRWFTGKWDVYVIAIPGCLAVIVVFIAGVAIWAQAADGADTSTGYLDLFLLPFVLALPFLNPRRLIDVGALSFGIIAISYIADFAEAAVKGFFSA